jgi:hypothetical protein
MTFQQKRETAHQNLVATTPKLLGPLTRWGPEVTDNLNLQKKGWQENWHTTPKTDYYNFSGLYVFWWVGKKSVLDNAAVAHLNQGKQYKEQEDDARFSLLDKEPPIQEVEGLIRPHLMHPLNFKFNWLPDDQYEWKAPLYVGKASGVFDRVKHHLLWHNNFVALSPNVKKYYPNILPRHTGRQQFRVGFEYLFQKLPVAKRHTLLESNIALSVLPTPADDVSFRFYEEDYMIGLLRPAFNVDSER